MARRNQTGKRQRFPVRRLMRAINRADLGTPISPPADPPRYTPIPWWPITLAFVMTAKGDITPKVLYSAFKAQTSLTDATFTFRLISLKCWSTQGESFALSVPDVMGDATRWKTLSDVAGKMTYARTGWRYGNVAAGQSHAAAAATVLASIEMTGNEVRVHAQVLVCSDKAAKPTALALPIVTASKNASTDLTLEQMAI